MKAAHRCFLPDGTTLSSARLRTADARTQLAFYTRALGLTLRGQAGSEFRLSPDGGQSSILTLSQDGAALFGRARSIGLYHFALRYPTRQDLARAYRRLRACGYPVEAAIDHGVSEAFYLTDPDGNGVELYADRPRSQWRWQNGQVTMGTRALDVESLLVPIATEPTTVRPSAPELGHIHLHVADLADAERFYSEFLGLAVTHRSLPGALFFASGGYHHHLAVNVWAGRTTPPANSTGLIAYRLTVPVPEILYCLGHRAPLMGYEATLLQENADPVLQIRDPNGTWVELQAPPAASADSDRCHLAGVERGTD